MQWFKAFADLFIDAGIKYSKDNCPRFAAALSYYTVFSLAPLLIIMVAILSLYYDGSVTAREQLVSFVEGLANPQIGEIINRVIISATAPVQSAFASAIAIITFLIGATKVLVELRVILNTIWGFAQKDEEDEDDLTIFHHIVRIVLVRLFTILILLVISFALLGILLVSTYFSVMNSWLAANTGDTFPISQVLIPLFTIGICTLLFYITMLILPAHRPPKGAVLFGAFIAAIVFNLGKTLLSIYLARAAAASVYGAASSLVVLMLWIYFSASVFLYGAQLAATIRLKKLEREKNALETQNKLNQTKRASKQQENSNII